MSPREGVFYVGLMVGLIVGVGIARAMMWHHLIGLAVGVVIGLGAGAAFQTLYDRTR